uniref:Uncharacterized protein n=1 Tax=Takifugu rubripes TaxID=31033 RepID=A0A3B5KDZ2_TAKRU
ICRQRSVKFVVEFVLFVCPSEDFLTHPLTCYILDAFLLAYCIIATMVYLKLKYLQRPLNPDLYQELEPLQQKVSQVINWSKMPSNQPAANRFSSLPTEKRCQEKETTGEATNSHRLPALVRPK